MNDDGVVSSVPAQYRGLIPFRKGDPRINRNGPISNKTKKVRKRLMKFDEQAFATLERLFSSEDPGLQVEALKFWGKYRLVVPSAKSDHDKFEITRLVLPDSVATQLAELDG